MYETGRERHKDKKRNRKKEKEGGKTFDKRVEKTGHEVVFWMHFRQPLGAAPRETTASLREQRRVDHVRNLHTRDRRGRKGNKDGDAGGYGRFYRVAQVQRSFAVFALRNDLRQTAAQ